MQQVKYFISNMLYLTNFIYILILVTLEHAFLHNLTHVCIFLENCTLTTSEHF